MYYNFLVKIPENTGKISYNKRKNATMLNTHTTVFITLRRNTTSLREQPSAKYPKKTIQ